MVWPTGVLSMLGKSREDGHGRASRPLSGFTL